MLKSKAIATSRHGFTIVELLVVIVVIGVLATLTVTLFNEIDNRARISRANSEMREIGQLIKMAVNAQGKPLARITNNEWTLGQCYYNSRLPYTPMKRLPKTDNCWVHYQSAINNIAIAAGTPQSAASFLDGDPWGSPYLIDENELSSSTPCAKDILESAGKRGIPFLETSFRYELAFSISSGTDPDGQPCP